MSMRAIEHVVLLMLENRSFDSMLGWLYEKGSPQKHIPQLEPNERAYHGLQGLDLDAFTNSDESGTIRIPPIRGARGLGVPNTAPGEEFERVAVQLFDKDKPGPNDEPTMRGYVRDFVRNLEAQGASADQLPQLA